MIGIIIAYWITRNQVMLEQMIINLLGWSWTADQKFVEKGLIRPEFITLYSGNLISCVMGFVIAKLGNLAQPMLSKQAQVYSCSQCQQSLVGTDIRCGSIPADVLFSGG